MNDAPPTTPDTAALALRSDEAFGAWVERIREARGWSREQLALLADVLEAQITRVEEGGVLRQHSTRVRLREVLETGEPYAPLVVTAAPEPEVDDAPAARAKPSGPPTPLERLAVQSELLGGPREGSNVATQATAFARWVVGRDVLWSVRLGALLPGLSAAPDPPSKASRTLRTHETLRDETGDTWREIGNLTLDYVTELPRGDRRMARELLEIAAIAWARLPD